MIVEVKLFAVAKDLAGADRVELDLAPGATVADLKQQLIHRVPKLKALAGHLMIAVNRQYADETTSIPPAADLACIPPVSGG